MNPQMMNRAIGIRSSEAAEPEIDHTLEAAKRAIAAVKQEREAAEAKQLDVERIQRRLLDQVSGHDAA